MDADIWIENIPYTETRGYIQHIVEHIVAFAAMRDAAPPRLSSLLPKIGLAAPAAAPLQVPSAGASSPAALPAATSAPSVPPAVTPIP